MYGYKKNKIVINGKEMKFDYDIRTVIVLDNYYYVLLSIPFNVCYLNNLYCIDKNGNLVWQSEDLNSLFPTVKNLPYEYIGIKDNVLHAIDFYGRNYQIRLFDGKVEKCNIVK